MSSRVCMIVALAGVLTSTAMAQSTGRMAPAPRSDAPKAPIAIPTQREAQAAVDAALARLQTVKAKESASAAAATDVVVEKKSKGFQRTGTLTDTISMPSASRATAALNGNGGTNVQ